MLQLSIQDYEDKSTVIPLTDGELTIGREDSNAICLTERNVSRRHARIVTQAGRVYLENLAATYGTRLNNTLVRERTELSSEDVVQIGDYTLQIVGAGQIKRDTALVDEQASAGAQAPPPKKTPENATAIVNLADIQQAIGGNDAGDAAAIPAAEQPRLVVVSDNLKGWEGRVARSPTVIGRVGDNADLVVDHRSISKEHARLTRKNDGTWEILDLGSANGIQVNGEPYSKVSIRSGDTLVLGHVTFRFLAAGERAPAGGAKAAGKSGGNKGILLAVVALLVLLAGGALAFVVLGGDAAASGDKASAAKGDDEDKGTSEGTDDKADDEGKDDTDEPGEAAAGAENRAAAADVVRKVTKLEKAGMLTEASAFAKDALKKQPGNAELGLLVKRLEAEQKVATRIDAAEQKLSKDPKAVFNAMTDLESDAKSSPALAKRVATLKAKAKSLVVAGLAVESEKQLSRRRYAQARDLAEMCLELDPSNKTCAEVMVKAKGKAKAKARPSRRERPAPVAKPTTPKPAAKPTPRAPPKAAEKPAAAAEMSAKDYYRAGRTAALNDKKKAAALFEKAAAKGYKRAHGKLARLYYQLGNMAKCASHGKQYVNRYPDAGDAQQIEGLVEKCK